MTNDSWGSPRMSLLRLNLGGMRLGRSGETSSPHCRSTRSCTYGVKINTLALEILKKLLFYDYDF
jgi:hypothetical protein